MLYNKLYIYSVVVQTIPVYLPHFIMLDYNPLKNNHKINSNGERSNIF